MIYRLESNTGRTRYSILRRSHALLNGLTPLRCVFCPLSRRLDIDRYLCPQLLWVHHREIAWSEKLLKLTPRILGLFDVLMQRYLYRVYNRTV